LLEKFTGHSYSILNEEKNYIFLDCISDNEIHLPQIVVTEIIKVLSNNHIRRTLPARVLIVLAKTITASLHGSELSEEVVGQCLKAFNDSMFHKTNANDPLIMELRASIGRLFLGIMRRHQWEDGYKNEAVFSLCEES
jgi:hypothetical protein